jgi:type I restriction enzyme, R subunit
MSPHAYTEDQLVEQPAIGLFEEIGWETVSAMHEVFGLGGTLGRETKGEVVLAERLHNVLIKFNPTLPAESINSAIDELTRDRSAMSLEAANREIYTLMKEGLIVSIPDHEHGGQKQERLRIVDWERPEENDFLLVSQFTVVGTMYTCRPDLIGFVNGLPWVVIELKKPGVSARAAFDDNLTHYKEAIPSLFWYNVFLIASNGTDSRVGSITAAWNRFFEWKRIEREDEPRRVSLEVMIRGTCDHSRLLDLVENFAVFSEHKAGLIKIIGQNHQYLGVNNAIASMLEARKMGHGRGGVFWQTQGSGKSFSMVFYAQKVMRKLAGNWTFVVVTDRVELDEQIAKTFKATGAVSETEGDQCHASSGAHLRELLRGNHRYVFTLVHKFQTSELLSDRSDVVVLTDEAHRSQYDTLALNMRSALPKALFLAFTGTPLIAGEERTKDVFGDYVSIYDFQQSVEDGATVPLFYENRTPELNLANPDLNDDIYAVIEDAGLDPEQEAKLEKQLGRQYHLITRDDRLDTVAKDIVTHFLGRGFVGKAIVVSIDKATAIRMYDKVNTYWKAERARVEKELGLLAYKPTGGESPESEANRYLRRDELTKRLDVLTSTDMAVIVSPGQNEIQQMKQMGLDIEVHRKRMNDSQPGLDERFKDTEDPLRLAFVCAMWLTGFDAPSCSTIYLDKPMRNHTLMQTIARANRVFPGKHSGLIVDYANVFASLELALAIYGAGKGGNTPVRDKKQLLEDLRESISEAVGFCSSHRVMIGEIESLTVGSMERLSRIQDAVNTLIAPESVRRDFVAHERLVSTLFRAVKPDPTAIEFTGTVSCLTTIADAIKIALNPDPPDITEVMGEIGKLLDQSILGHEIHELGPPVLDLSKINFEALASRFKQAKHKNTEIEVLKAAIRKRLDAMIQLNSTRADFAEKFQELIDSYNAGSRSIEQLFHDLLALTDSLNEEQERHVRENMTEEELVIFDILTRPAPELSAEERKEVKKVARELLARLKALLVLDWRRKSSARSLLKLSIEDILDAGLPRGYTPELYRQKCSSLFEHVYEKYPQQNVGVYSRQ